MDIMGNRWRAGVNDMIIWYYTRKISPYMYLGRVIRTRPRTDRLLARIIIYIYRKYAFEHK